jgi:broad specificity phosphatase PhoE
MRRRLILMRHGAVQYFDPASRTPLHAESVPLTAEGQDQAAAAGRLLAAAGLRPDRVIHSGLPRTAQTAAGVLAHCGGPAPEVWPELQEARGGRLRDIAPERLQQAFTQLQRGPLSGETRFLGGESIAELQARVLPALQRLRAEPGWDTALVVAHGVVNAVLLSFVVSGGQSIVLPGWQQNPAALNLIDLGREPGDDLLRAVNLNPIDWLQPQERASTMEKLYDQFTRWQQETR